MVKMNNIKKETEVMKQTRLINNKIEKDLIKFYPLIKEANIISEELNRRI